MTEWESEVGTISRFTLVFVATSALLFFLFEMALSAALPAWKREEEVGCVGVVVGVNSGVLEQPQALLSTS